MSYTQEEWTDIFGDNLRDVLKETGYTQTDLAKATCIKRESINQYIKKKRVPEIPALIEMSAELDISIHELAFFGERIDDDEEDQ